MESTCPSCQQLVNLGRPHPNLVIISSLQHSQLFKCANCNSFLHRDQDGWEILSSGGADIDDHDDHRPALFPI